MGRMVANALVTLLALLLSMGASRGEENWVSYKDGTIEWLCQKIEGTETYKIKPANKGDVQTEVTIPSEVTIDGKTLKVVTVAEDAFSDDCEKLAKVTISEGIKAIEDNAFSGCAALSTLQLPQSLKVIGEKSFEGCALSSVNIYVNVESIGYDAFQDCSELEKFEVATENGHFSEAGGVLFNKDMTALLCCPMKLRLSEGSYDIPKSVKSIGACAFYGNGNLKTVTIPDEVTAIGKHAFNGCSVLEKVVVPNEVTTIEENTFYSCGKLSSVELPVGVKTIGVEAFSMCESLKSVKLHEGLTSIGASAFAFSTNFSEVTIPTSVTEIGEGAFSSTALTAVVIPAGIKELKGTLSGCGNLEKVTLPEGLEVLDGTFFGCGNLTEITIPASVTEIGSFAFSNTALTSVAIPAGVKELPGAFTDCPNLEKVTLPEGLEGLNGTFSNCPKLTEITIPARVKSIADYTFLGCTALNKVYYLAAAGAAVTDAAFEGIANPATLIVRREDKDAIEEKAWVKNGKFTVVAEKNKVTFSTDGGKPAPEVLWVKYGENAVRPAEVPVKEGFKFEGWTCNGEDYKFDIPVIKDIELKAKYIAEYTLTITAGTNGSVKVTRDNAQGEELTSETKLHEGDKLFIAATPAADYELETLTVNGNNQANSSVFTVGKANVEVKGTFKKKGGVTPPAVAEYTLTITAGTNGSVKVTRNDAQGEELTSETKLHEGDKLFIAATPAADYELETLTVNGNNQANSSVFTVGKANVEVKGTFKAQGGVTPPAVAEYTLTITAGTNGSVKVTRDNAQGEELTSETKLHEGDKLFIAATPAADYELETLTVNGNNQANSSVFTVGKANVEVKATFKAQGGVTPPAVAEYTLTITAGANGSVKVTRDNAQGEELTSETKLHEGDKLFIAATPAADYELETLTVNGNNQANSSVFTVGKANVEVKATFKAKGGATPPSAVESVLLAAARVVQNPIDNALVLEGVSTAERIEVYSLTGTPTYSRALHGEERVEIATGSWASGIYVVRIIAADGEKAVKVVKR